MNRLLCIAALTFALPASPAAPRSPEDLQARPGRPAPEERLQRRLDRTAEFLKLSETQKASIKALHEKDREAAKVRRDAAHSAAKAFRDAVQDPKVTTDQLRRLHQAMADARFESLAGHLALRLEIRNLLTPEQREKAGVLKGMALERRRERMMRVREGRGPGMGPRMGPGRGMGPGRRDGAEPGPGRGMGDEGGEGFED